MPAQSWSFQLLGGKHTDGKKEQAAVIISLENSERGKHTSSMYWKYKPTGFRESSAFPGASENLHL